MVGGRKRASDAADSGPTTRSAKVAKTDNSTTATGSRRGKGGANKAGKPNIGASAFKKRALPLHVNITHTPSVIGDADTSAAAEGDEKQDTAETTLISVSHRDPGFIGSTTLIPTVFSTGSYGWKGTRRFAIELQDAPVGEGGEKEKVHVILTMNATVLGSKSVKDKEEDAERKDEEHHDEDQNGAEVEHVEVEPTEEVEAAS